MLSKEEWRRTAELAAAAEDGRKHAGWLRFKRFGAVPTGILAVTAAVGLGTWWFFAHVVSPLFSGSGPSVGIPIGFWLVAGLALFATLAAWRVRVPSGPFLITRAILSFFVWLALAAYAVAMLAS